MKKYTYEESLNFLEKLNKLENRKYSTKLLLIVEKTKITLNSIKKDIQKRFDSCSTEGFKKFEDARFNLIKLCGEKDESGNVKIENNNALISKDKLSYFNEKILELQNEYSNDIDKTNENLKEFDSYIKKESEFTPTTVGQSYFPEEMTPELFDTLKAFIKEEE